MVAMVYFFAAAGVVLESGLPTILYFFAPQGPFELDLLRKKAPL